MRKSLNLKRFISIIALIFYIAGVPAYALGKAGSAEAGEVVLYDRTIAKSITYSEKQIYNQEKNIKQRMNIITADLNDSDVALIFSKAKDKEKKAEVLTQQIYREIFKGNNVVAGVNADMFNMTTGFSTGPQIKDGAIIAGHSSKSEEKIYPVFGIDTNNRVFIDNIYMDARITSMSTGNSTSIDNINRESYTNSLILNTSQLNEYKKIDFSNYALKGALTVIKGIKAPIMLGQEYEGIVETLGSGIKGTAIPDDGVILASNGAKNDWVKNNLKPGDRVRIKINYSRSGIQEVIGAYTYLVKNGNVLTTSEMIKNGASSSLVYARKARTAIGITNDNKVIAITTDGGTPSAGVSDGITLSEMAQTMKDMGAVYAVAMDGGGSTQMNVKLYGESDLRIVNKPSDGIQRALTNGILFVSRAPRSGVIGIIQIDRDVTIYKGSNYQFNIRGTDTNYNPVDFSNVSLNWSVDEKLGSVDSKGIFTAGSMLGEGVIKASASGIEGSANIKVVDTIDDLGIDGPSSIMLDAGSKRQFALSAHAVDESPIIISNTSAQWSVTGGIGTIDSSGLLTVTAKGGSGEVIAQVGDKRSTVKVSVEETSFVVDSFEHNEEMRYKVEGSVGGLGKITNEQYKSGKYSYKVTYDYDTKWDRKNNGTINIVPAFVDKSGNDITESYITNLRPKKLGMWVYGDGKAPWLRAVITDGESNNRTIDIVPRIDWTGWKYVDADIPPDVPLPVSLNYIYMVECSKNLHNKGSVYFDDIKFVYSDAEDLRGPSFSDFKPTSTLYKRDADISVTIKDDKSGINTKSIKARLDGKNVSASFSNGILTYRARGLTEGIHTFEVDVSDNSGNRANPTMKKSFSINLKPDKTIPVIKNLTPVSGYMVDSPTPRIAANIKDYQSGIDVKNISIVLDGRKLIPYYDEASGWVYAIPDAGLVRGEHTVVINAKDRAGNAARQESSTFVVEPLEGPINPNRFTISVTSDTHATGFGNEILSIIDKDESEIVIHNGDLIDEDEQQQWYDAIAQVDIIKDKPLILSPGNHEVIDGTLENYMATFGLASPTYSYEFGNSLFIALNSANGQSISVNDPTQFDYLQRLLSKNKKQNIFIYTHVPTRDSFGTGHQMLKADADKLEKILGDYKKLNPSKSINVIFGHLHTSQSWEVSGVTYTITGNGCLKRYVKPENGGFLGYTQFIINGSSVSHRFVPVVERISIVDSSILKGEMKIVQGAKKQLSLYGDFTALNSDYIIPLNQFNGLGATWYSDNPSIISITDGGMVTAIRTGSANIRVSLAGKNCTLKITSISQGEVAPVRIDITPAKVEAVSGGNTKLEVKAFDLYGNSYILDNTLVKFEIPQDLGSIKDGVYTSAKGNAEELSGNISALYGTLSTSIPVKVLKAKKYVVVTTATLNLRDKASTTGKILGTLKSGDKVEIISEEKDWIKVNYKGKTGYIIKKYTKSVN